MTKQQILEYILKTPNNTNPNVLAPMIDSLIGNTEKVNDFSSAVASIKSGKNLILSENINADDEVTTDGAVNVEVNLNGKELKASSQCGNWLLCAQNGAKMIIDGKGLISVGESQKAIPVSAYHGAEITILNGTFESGKEGQCVYCENSHVDIYGGEYRFKGSHDEGDVLLNVKNTGRIEDIQVYGGTFYGWSPAQGDDNLGGSFVAPGHKVIEIGEKVYKVVKE